MKKVFPKDRPADIMSFISDNTRRRKLKKSEENRALLMSEETLMALYTSTSMPPHARRRRPAGKPGRPVCYTSIRTSTGPSGGTADAEVSKTFVERRVSSNLTSGTISRTFPVVVHRQWNFLHTLLCIFSP